MYTPITLQDNPISCKNEI